MKYLIKEESGAYSLEATLALPLVFVIIAVMLLFAGYTYEKTALYGAAAITSERTAFVWDNSYRDARSGLAAAEEYDGLYWRIGEDGMLQSLFGLRENDIGSAAAAIGADRSGSRRTEEAEAGRSMSLPERKLARSSGLLSDANRLRGEIRYRRDAVTRRIATLLRMPMDISLLRRWSGRSEPAAAAVSVIVEPTEFIRMIDLVRYYTSKFGSGGDSADRLKRAGKIVHHTAESAAHD